MTKDIIRGDREVALEDVVRESAKVSDSWVKLVSVVGIPGVIALWMIYQFTNAMQADIRELNKAMPMHVQATETLNNTNIRILNTLQNICVNMAKNKAEKDNCFNQGR